VSVENRNRLLMYQANLCASSFLAKIIASSVINSLARDFVSLQFMFRLEEIELYGVEKNPGLKPN